MKQSFLLIIGLLAFSFCGRELIDIEPDGYYTDPRDSLVYPFVGIGVQTWMIKNLAYDAEQGCYAYKNEEKYVADYGRLYTYEVAVRACPLGWHLPSDKEWKDLEVFLGMDIYAADSVDWRRSGEVALALKNTSGWYSGGNGSNTSMFTALPGGFRSASGNFFVFGDVANYWTSSYSSESHAWGRAMIYYEVGVYRWKYEKQEAFSVRCLKN